MKSEAKSGLIRSNRDIITGKRKYTTDTLVVEFTEYAV